MKAAPGDKTVLHIADKPLDLAFGLRRTDAADLWNKAHVHCKISELRIPNRLACLSANDYGFHVVREYGFGDAAEVKKSVYHTALETAEVTAGCKLHIFGSGCAQYHDEGGDLVYAAAAVLVLADAPVHLCLLSRKRFKTPDCRNMLCRSVRMDVVLDDADAAVIALCLQTFQQNHAVEDTAVHELMQKRLVGVQLRRTVNSRRCFLLQLQILFGCVLGNAQFFADGIAAFPRLCFFSYHDDCPTP